MTPSAFALLNEAPPAGKDRQTDPRPRRIGDAPIYVVLLLLTLATWWVSRLQLFKPGDDVGYWLGVAGGVMMLLLLSYPLRKHLRLLHRLGRVKWWFVVHMTLGIAGPMLILLHSTFHVGSVNAGVALFSMVTVALSGVVGRFLYAHVHSGLLGEHARLNELQARAGLVEGEMKSRLRFAPEVAARLLAFEAQALEQGTDAGALWRKVVLLPWRRRATYRACVFALHERLQQIGRERGWSHDHLRRRRRKAAALVRDFLDSIVRVSQFTVYERLFALWHVLHVPFVYPLAFSAAFHVFAVHAY